MLSAPSKSAEWGAERQRELKHREQGKNDGQRKGEGHGVSLSTHKLCLAHEPVV